MLNPLLSVNESVYHRCQTRSSIPVVALYVLSLIQNTSHFLLPVYLHISHSSISNLAFKVSVSVSSYSEDQVRRLTQLDHVKVCPNSWSWGYGWTLHTSEDLFLPSSLISSEDFHLSPAEVLFYYSPYRVVPILSSCCCQYLIPVSTGTRPVGHTAVIVSYFYILLLLPPSV